MNNKSFSATKKITYFAVLTAITVVLQLVGNTVRIGFVTLNFSLIPIVLASVLLGVWYGTALGAITGLIILFNNGILGADGFTNVLFSTDPVILSLVCVLKTALAGTVSALIYKALKKANPYLATVVAAASVPVVNTGIFIVGMLLITDSLYSVGFIAEGANAFVTIITVFVGFNFIFEFAVNVIVAPAIYRVITVVDKSVLTDGKEKEEKPIKTENTEETENNK